jgi:uncharacterized protein (TIGR03083 family)
MPTTAGNTETIDEVGELLVTLLATPASRVTACRGWTAHELVAHLAAGAAEEAELIEAHLRGDPERPTRGFEERELPFRALPDAQLRDRLVEEAARLTVALDRLAGEPARGGVLFTGRAMTAADFAMHSRSECALHRWDLVGRDDVGWAMLSQPELTTHALGVLASMWALPEAPVNRLAHLGDPEPIRTLLRSTGHDDVVVTVRDGTVAIRQVPIDTRPASIELDAAARLLLLWGRREPSAPVDLDADLDADGGARRVIEALLGR